MNTIDELEEYSDNILDIVSSNVKKYREEKGLTQMQLALEIGLTGGAYLGRAGLFRNLCQSGKITNTQGNTDEDRNRCRTICS